MRGKLQTEVAALVTAEDLVAWAASVLPTKNSLQTADARAVEQAFEEKRSALEAKERSSISSQTAGDQTGSSAAQAAVPPDDEPSSSPHSENATQAGQGSPAVRRVRSLASSAGAHLAMLTTSASPSREHSAARSATSLPFHSVALTIGKCTIEGTRGRGGRRS